MTSMVQTDLSVPSTGPKYKEDPDGDSLPRPTPAHPHHSLQHSRSTAVLQQLKQRPSSPRQSPSSVPSVTYATSHGLGTTVLQHQHQQQQQQQQQQQPYAQRSQEPPYYPPHPSPYTPAGSQGQYPSSGPSSLMAATAHMQRQYPPMYHSSQSNAPAPVAAPTQDQHSRNIYAPSPNMAPHIYGYASYSPINSVQPSQYTQHAPPQQHHLTSSPMIVPHQTTATPVPHHPSPSQAVNGSPNLKLDTATPQPAAQPAVFNPAHPASTGPQGTVNNVHQSTPVGASSSAAPGPIPATTPLVVRQDSNGVQWIAFEYSRDRIKMEYTIRCDVESVNVDKLSQDFKNENCVYPRACCSKDQYRGNRLVYETECNAVGWALAELNPTLRGKRGLIQRAVDSWRNSNQDPRLRSRRVRRMAKLNRRQAQNSPQVASAAAVAAPIPSGISAPSLAASGPRSGVTPLPLGHSIHHHHPPEGNPGNEEVSGSVEYVNSAHLPSIASGHLPQPAQPADIRTAQVFHGYPSFPPVASVSSGPSMPPPLRDSGVIAPISRHPTVATSTKPDEEEEDCDERNPDKDALFGDLPDGKRRKFILVDDTQRGNRVRVRVTLDQVDMNEIPDSYRMANSVYPRTYFPVQMKESPGRVVPGKRYFKNDTEIEDSNGTHTGSDDESIATVGRTFVPAPSVDGESDIAVPKLSRNKRKKDILLNDLGYRMSWSQSRVFAGRMLFLQRSLDAYRNKMRSTALAAGHDTSSIPQHFETRIGKRRWLERRGRGSNGVHAPGASTASSVSTLSASKRSAEEVEG